MESSREIEQRILDFSRQLAEEFGDISCDQFGSPFEAIEVRGADAATRLRDRLPGLWSDRAAEKAPVAEAANDPGRNRNCGARISLPRMSQVFFSRRPAGSELSPTASFHRD
jgi:hypothetical protein